MKEWVFPIVGDERGREEIARRLDVSPVTAGALLARGVRSVGEARSFLSPSLDDLADPGLLPDMEKAVETICRHARDNSRIVIYGDYDADGLCAMTMLMQFLRLAGLDPSHYVPERAEEGYGVHGEALRELRAGGAGLVITTDCGISSVAEAALAREIGLELVITDHHEPSGPLPDAAAVVNPKIAGSAYPFKELAGVGVAFKLVWALAERLSHGHEADPSFRKFLMDSMALVAVGTIADVVPLVSENRIFAKFGLEALRCSEMPGLQALMRQCQLIDRELDTDSVSYKLGPRLNVAGRMASADLAMRLLMTDSFGEGERIAQELEELNRERQRIQREIVEAARERIVSEHRQDDYVYVLADEHWPTGIIGIVASHLVEEFYRPTVLISLEGPMGRGSARSTPALNIIEALTTCRRHLNSFGGHAQAAGITIAKEHIEAFRAELNAHARTRLSADDFRPKLAVDAEVLLDSLSRDFVEELGRLAPFGPGAPEVVLAARDVQTAGRPRRVGTSGKHLAVHLSQGGTAFRAVGFGMGELAEKLPGGRGTFHVAFTPVINTFNDRSDVELRIKDVEIPGEGRS